jgi:hypothetical protein
MSQASSTNGLENSGGYAISSEAATAAMRIKAQRAQKLVGAVMLVLIDVPVLMWLSIVS